MKEIMAIIRMDKMNETKDALSEAGFSSMTARKAHGRGKKMVDFPFAQDIVEDMVDAPPRAIEALSEKQRLLPKRMIMMVVEDDQVDEAVKVIVETNQTGNMGDGKIFVLPVSDVAIVRTGEMGVL